MKKGISMLLALVMCLALCVPALAAPTPPSGYTYLGKENGHTAIDAERRGEAGLVACTIVGTIGGPVGTVFSFLVSWVDLKMQTREAINNNGQFTGYYTEWVYECDDPGIYPYIYWHYFEFYDDSARTNLIGVKQCEEYALLPRMVG